MEMKKIASLLFVILAWPGLAQETLTKTINHDGSERSYTIYIPEIYDQDESVPLILNFHGYGSTSSEQMWYGDFREIADTANFIVVHPQGAVHDDKTHWNVNGWIINSPYDDVDFVETLIDDVTSEYNIATEKIYATGMSNGGFFSFLLSCQLSEKIAAIASVTGSMTPSNFNSCDPQRPVPIMQIHGTSDPIISYSGAIWSLPVSEVISFWVNHNNCDQNPIITDLPNINENDGSTVSHFIYKNGENGSMVEHLRINDGGHTWPGSIFNTAGTNQDISASRRIWEFFSKYDLNGKITTSVDKTNHSSSQVIYNPSTRTISIDSFSNNTTCQLVSSNGQVVFNGNSIKEIDVSNIKNGLYFINLDEVTIKIVIY